MVSVLLVTWAVDYLISSRRTDSVRQNHWLTYVAQVVIGLIFSGIYFVVFRYLILKFDIPLPGRRAEEEVKLFSKKIIKRKKAMEVLTILDSNLAMNMKRKHIII